MPKTKKSSPKELVLNGAQLSHDEKLQELITGFKSSIATHPVIPVVLDLTRLNALYSKGIAVILGLFKDCKAVNREFRIQVASDEIFNLFKMLKLDKVITIRKAEQ